MNFYLIAGEASGDARGAELIRSLRARREDIDISGFGGPQMAALRRRGTRLDRPRGRNRASSTWLRTMPTSGANSPSPSAEIAPGKTGRRRS